MGSSWARPLKQTSGGNRTKAGSGGLGSARSRSLQEMGKGATAPSRHRSVLSTPISEFRLAAQPSPPQGT